MFGGVERKNSLMHSFFHAQLGLVWAWRVQADSCKPTKHMILWDYGHVPPPLACRRDVEAFQWSSGRSDPHVSNSAFGLVS